MRSDWSPLAPTFRSRLQGRLLALVLLHPETEWSISDLARRLDAPLTTVQTEASRLVDGRVLLERKVGRSRLLRSNRDNPAVAPLTNLVDVTFGPQVVIAQAFAGVGASRLVIFGSWAARYAGVRGEPPRDIDVLVVGDTIDRGALFDAADKAQRTLGGEIEVNPVVRSSRAWHEADSDPLLADLKTKPYVELAPWPS